MSLSEEWRVEGVTDSDDDDDDDDDDELDVFVCDVYAKLGECSETFSTDQNVSVCVCGLYRK